MDLYVIDLFNEKWTPVTESGCWIWTASVDRNGYGNFHVKRKTKIASRVSWEIYRGPIPAGHHVLHHCDVSCCVNPAHLYLGDAKDNARDTLVRRRNPLIKMTDDDIRNIRNSLETQRSLADRYGTTPSNIHYIRSGKYWKHVA